MIRKEEKETVQGDKNANIFENGKKVSELLEEKEIVNVMENELSVVDSVKNDEDKEFFASTILQYDEPTKWPTITDKIRTILVLNGPKHPDENLSYPVSADGRSFSYKWFFKTLPDGEQVKRSWLIYSKLKNVIFCFPCLLFSEDHKSNFANLTNGFNNWRHLCPRLPNHENSPGHRKCYVAWKEMERRLKEGKTIDSDLEKQINTEAEKWRHIIKVNIDIILFCGKNNLPLRGSTNTIGDFNCGIFLDLVKMISHYDTILAQHVENLL